MSFDISNELGSLLNQIAAHPIDDSVRASLSAGPERFGDLKPLWVSLSGVAPRIRLIAESPQGSVLIEGKPNAWSLSTFRSTDYGAIQEFVEQAPELKPRPQREKSAIATGNRHPEISLPAAFRAFKKIEAKHGVNLASTVQLSATREMTLPHLIAERSGENPVTAGHTRVDIKHLFHCGLWAAIQAGFRNGYSAEADHFIVTGTNADEIDASMELCKESIRMAADYTKFTTDTSRVFELQADERHPKAWSTAEIDARWAQLLSVNDQKQVLQMFAKPFDTGSATYSFSESQIKRLTVKFGRSLLLNEELYDEIVAAKNGEPFDFEPSLDEAETLTTPQELIFYMHWLKQQGRPAQLVPPNLGFKKRQAYPETWEQLKAYSGYKMWPEVLPACEKLGGDALQELGNRIRALSDVARFFDATLSVHSGSGKQEKVLRMIGEATDFRFNYKISGELQLQLFDVLREQPQGSPARELFQRMVARCEAFAEKNLFGDESKLASKYRGSHGNYLGDYLQGRVDGNLFLVFWLGNLVGSRDIASPDGDQDFFKNKIDRLPLELIQETQRRNEGYICWLADCLLEKS
jgi:hypothetical protein